jgi:hypothetical protein
MRFAGIVTSTLSFREGFDPPLAAGDYSNHTPPE